jgi:hypothetical protein
MNSWPTRSSASCWFGDEVRLRLDPEPQRLTLAVEDALDPAARQVVDRVGVEVVLDVARQRTAEDDVARHPREVVELVGEHL